MRDQAEQIEQRWQQFREEAAKEIDMLIETVACRLIGGYIINDKNQVGWTPLFYAVLIGDVEMADILLDRRADIHTHDEEGQSALSVALGNNDIEMLQVFLRHDILSKVDEFTRTALHIAARISELDVAAFLLKNGADVAAKDLIGGIPLHCAAMTDCTELVQLLLKSKSDVATTDK
ncbi:hypothetical protein V7S43_018689 [Phytophthora oleae]|uniref:Ankyrin repeat protein n=1 Tax=Phytophthora oleae TaxID=2107226 RepID=A0ABD3EQN5_9STRA